MGEISVLTDSHLKTGAGITTEASSLSNVPQAVDEVKLKNYCTEEGRSSNNASDLYLDGSRFDNRRGT
jgi:hypothetical protein